MTELNGHLIPENGDNAVLRYQECFFWCTAAVLLFVFLGGHPLAGSEGSLAEISREMLISGNIFHAAENWNVMPEQSLLHCWSVLPFAKLAGPLSEWPLRIPSAAAALAALYGLRLLGRELFTPRITLMSCWLLLGCYGFLFWGRYVAEDMIILAAAVLAAACFFRMAKNCSFTGYMLFFFICTAGSLFRSLESFIVPLIIILPWLIKERCWKKHLNWKMFLAAVINLGIFFGISLLPYMISPAAEQFSPAIPDGMELVQMLLLENITGIFNIFQRHDSWYYYLYNLPKLLLPGTFIIAVGAAGMIKRWKDLPGDVRALMTGTGIAFILFTVAGRWYYVLPLLPFCCLLGSAGILNWGVNSWNKAAADICYYACLVTGSLFICSIIAYPLWNKLAREVPSAMLLAAPPAAGIITWCAMFMDHGRKNLFSSFIGLPCRLGSAVFAMTLLSGTVIAVMIPEFQKQYRFNKDFHISAHQLAIKHIPDLQNSQIVHLGRVHHEYLFYNNLQSPVLNAASLAEAAEKLSGRQAMVIFRGSRNKPQQFIDDAAKLGITAGEPVLTEKKHRWNSSDSIYRAYIIKFPEKISVKGGK